MQKWAYSYELIARELHLGLKVSEGSVGMKFGLLVSSVLFLFLTHATVDTVSSPVCVIDPS